MTQDEMDDAVASQEAAEREKALAEGWHLVAQGNEAIVACSELARRLAIWRADNPSVAEMIPLQEVEKLAREGIV